jgi:mRNA interferase MazF
MSLHRGEIYFVNLNPIKGREQAGSRPVVVLSIDRINRSPLVVTVVIGTSATNVRDVFPSNALVTAEESGLPEDTVFLGFQIRSLDHARFPSSPAGQLTPDVLVRVEDAVRYTLGL